VLAQRVQRGGRLSVLPLPSGCAPQASALPEAVRVLASLLSTGHRVHISCLRGVTCSPLVVPGVRHSRTQGPSLSVHRCRPT